MNDNSQDPDLNFFHKMSLLLLIQTKYRQKILRVSLKIIPKNVSLFYIEIWEASVKASNHLKNFALY